ncbi:LptF/LptG family permease, partial [Xanthomonas sp. Kuri4-3]
AVHGAAAVRQPGQVDHTCWEAAYDLGARPWKAFLSITLPLSRSAPRQQRYGRMMLAFLAYMVGTMLMFNGSQWIATGKMPAALGLWWLLVPLLVLAVWMYARDGRLSRPRRPA